MSDVVQKLWGFCHTLRHDGIDYGDYIEQITYLLFLKMADEKGIQIPNGCSWPKIRDKSGTDVLDHYVEVLRKLGKTPGILGDSCPTRQIASTSHPRNHGDNVLCQALTPSSSARRHVPIIQRDRREYAMFVDLRKYPWVLPPVKFANQQDLLELMSTQVINRAEKRAKARQQELSKLFGR